MSGAPPDGHKNQCQARSSVTRNRCRRWALRGSSYCQFHGGRRSREVVRKRLPGFYSKYLGPKLKDRIEELLAQPHEAQLSLYEELAIARTSACEAIKLTAPLWDERQSKELTTEVKALMITTLGQAMTNVKELVLSAAKIEAAHKDKVSIKVINLIVYQIAMAVNEVCGTEHQSIAEAIVEAIDEKVRLPLNDKLAPNIKVTLGSNDRQLSGSLKSDL